MLKSMLAAGMVAGGLFAFAPTASAAVVSPSAVNAAADQPSSIVEVRRGHRGFVGGRHFGGQRFYGGGRHFAHRGFGRRHFSHGGWGGHRHGRWRRGGWPFFWGVAPFVGYGAYSSGYYGSSCDWLWRKYRITGSWYWHRRWQDCRYY
jgi:hypothetical protein